MKVLHILLAALATVAMAAAPTACIKDGDCPEPQPEMPDKAGESVPINGVEWATTNVGVAGAFAETPEDFGGLFTFDEAQTACPDGWRLPTKEELLRLCDRDVTASEWTGRAGVNGRLFGMPDDPAHTVFLPAAGYRDTGGAMKYHGSSGRYWSSTTSDDPFYPDAAWNLYFSDVNAGDVYNYDDRQRMCTVRCVLD